MFWFTTEDGTRLYMGKDKFENEDLIKFGWDEDVWFHVDNLSSAHVYARIAREPPAPGSTSLPPPATLDSLSEGTIRDCAQLVKANSLEGSKKPSVVVIYTLWSNLRKDGSMAAGAVSFHNERAVRRYAVGERDRDTLARLAKTREESHPDLKAVRVGDGCVCGGEGVAAATRLASSISRSANLTRAHAHTNTHTHTHTHITTGARAARRQRALCAQGGAKGAQRGGARAHGGAAAGEGGALLRQAAGLRLH